MDRFYFDIFLGHVVLFHLQVIWSRFLQTPKIVSLQKCAKISFIFFTCIPSSSYSKEDWSFWRFWKIINVSRILERYIGRVDEGLLRTGVSSIRLKKKYSRSRNAEDWEGYLKMRNGIVSIRRKVIKEHFKKLCDEKQANQKEFWKTIP